MKVLERHASSVSPARRGLTLRLVTVLAAGLFLLQAASPARSQTVAPNLRDFVGVNHLIGGNWSQQLGVGWFRFDIPWMSVEAQQGTMNWAATDKEMQNAQALGGQVLPMLGYTPAWDQTVKSSGQAPPKNPQDWANFVQAAVSRYSAAPYNVRYFQVWNEPTQKASFWLGTDNQYIDMIYLPAAKIIRQHGCYVVFGGWPASNSVQELDTVLNYHNAWQWTDYVDLHYQGIANLQHEYAQWVGNGKCRGLWETEVGYNTDPEFFGLYLQVLAWTQQVGWRDPNQFKLFWFAAYAAGAEGDKDLLKQTGTTLQPTSHGAHLIVVNQVLGGGPLRPFTQFSSQPSTTPNVATVNGISVGSNRTVLQFLMSRSLMQQRQSLTASVSLPGQPSKVQLMSGLGKTWNLPVQYSGGRVQVNAPLHADFDDCPTCHWVYGYLIIDR
jgi:hypothetical protein